MTIITIDKDTAIDAVKALIDENPEAKNVECVYVGRDLWFERRSELGIGLNEPVCVVGHVVHRLLGEDALLQLEGIGAVREHRHAFAELGFSERTIDFLDALQQRADRNLDYSAPSAVRRTWAEALKETLKREWQWDGDILISYEDLHDAWIDAINERRGSK